MVARFARAGRFVVAVDTLPPDLAVTPGTRLGSRLAMRLWRLERENTIGQLREHGVPVVAWAGAGSLDEVLRGVSPTGRRPEDGSRDEPAIAYAGADRRPRHRLGVPAAAASRCWCAAACTWPA